MRQKRLVAGSSSLPSKLSSQELARLCEANPLPHSTQRTALNLNLNNSVLHDVGAIFGEASSANLKPQLSFNSDCYLNWLHDMSCLQSYDQTQAEERAAQGGVRIKNLLNHEHFASSDKTCWICLGSQAEEDQSLPPKVWSSPCKCSGTSKWVHEACLLNWIQTARTQARSSSHAVGHQVCCPQCKHPYRLVTPTRSVWFELGLIALNFGENSSRYVYLAMYIFSQWLVSTAYGQFMCQFVSGSLGTLHISDFKARLVFFLLLATQLEHKVHIFFIYGLTILLVGPSLGVMPTACLLAYIMMLMDRPASAYKMLSGAVRSLKHVITPRIYSPSELRFKLLKRNLLFPMARMHETDDDILSSSFVLKLNVLLKHRPPRVPQSASYWDQPLQIYVEYPRSNIFMAMTQTRVDHFLSEQRSMNASTSREDAPVQSGLSQTQETGTEPSDLPARVAEEATTPISQTTGSPPSGAAHSGANLLVPSSTNSLAQSDDSERSFSSDSDQLESSINESESETENQQSAAVDSVIASDDEAVPEVNGVPGTTERVQTLGETARRPTFASGLPGEVAGFGPSSFNRDAGASSYHAVDPVTADRHIRRLLATVILMPLFVILVRFSLFTTFSPVGYLLHHYSRDLLPALSRELNSALNGAINALVLLDAGQIPPFDLIKFAVQAFTLRSEGYRNFSPSSGAGSGASDSTLLPLMSHIPQNFVTVSQLEYGIQFIISTVVLNIVKEELLKKFRRAANRQNQNTHVANYRD